MVFHSLMPPSVMGEENWTVSEAMAKLTAALGEKDITIEGLFEKIDADSDGVINGPELHHGIRNMIGDILSPGQISQMIQAFDVNGDHRIDLSELKNAMSEEE
jgi:Ca2+-binding EF-hand superfamily protein